MQLSWLNKSFKPKSNRIEGFVGRYYNKSADKLWAPHIPMTNSPINYLEIGVADGGNAINISRSYAKHPGSKIYCVDPWTDYDEYPEYKGQQEVGYNTFLHNITTLTDAGKFLIHRGFSDDIVPTFKNDFFDIIFVDGNHETEFVYRDGVMALEKVKIGGYIVFDDYLSEWKQTMDGVDKFIHDNRSKLDIVFDGEHHFGQIIVRRKL
jgi:predicted O-methyltransferase YrrM